MSKIWIITGANRGIGLEIARAALAAGDIVAATARSPGTIPAALGESDDRLMCLSVDVTKNEEMKAAVAAVTARFGRVDILVNNAGYGQLGWFENIADERVRDQFEVNVFGAMTMTRHVLPVMRRQKSGHIITISSGAGHISRPGSSIYSATKFAIEGWMEGLAGELEPLGIKATIVEPGFVRSDFFDPSSLNLPSTSIPEYAEAQAAFADMVQGNNHAQSGDPAKLGSLIVQLTQMENPPLRIAAGSDCVEVIIDKAERLKADAEKWRELSQSIDGVAEAELT